MNDRWKTMQVFLAALCVLIWAPAVSAQHHQGHGDAETASTEGQAALPLCPVMGDPVDFSAKTMTAEGPVYFCCKKCISKFEADPGKYAEKVAAQRAALAKMPKVQVTCPVSGEPVDTKVSAEFGGQKVFFCCKKCIGMYEKEPAKYAARLADSYTYQTRCPVMGDEIDPEVFITLATGQRIYFCCPKCGKKLLDNPENYAADLAAQGTRIDPDHVELAKEETDDDKMQGMHDAHEEHEGHHHGHHGD